jgi:hypothetical protein
MNRARHALCLGLALGLAECYVSGPGGPMGPVDIRVRNASTEIMEDIVVGFPSSVGGNPLAPEPVESGEVSYGTLPQGATTSYRRIQKAYRYAYVEAIVDGTTVKIQPIDYVGEDLLEPGHYTYELDYRDGHLGLELVRD